MKNKEVIEAFLRNGTERSNTLWCVHGSLFSYATCIAQLDDRGIVMKTRKWYSNSIEPDRANNLIIMTDMGYIFEAIYENGKFLVSNVKNYKVYFEPWIKQEDIIKWMKV